MTQKIMAKVRAEAEEKKTIFQRLFYPLTVKLPIQAIAVLFLAVTGFYLSGHSASVKVSEPNARVRSPERSIFSCPALYRTSLPRQVVLRFAQNRFRNPPSIKLWI